MSEAVLDASTFLACLFDERTDAALLKIVVGGVLSSVNLCEVLAKAAESGHARSPRLAELLGLLDRVEPFTVSQARLAADLRTVTKTAGLSLGDRACLALGMDLGATVYTADRAWATLDVDCEIVLIR